MVRTPTERLTQAELERARELAQKMTPGEVAREMRLAEPTVCRALAGFEVHRATAIVVRSYLAGGRGQGTI